VLRLSKPGAQATTQAHEVIERQARQMARLVEDLLDVSRLAMGKLALHRERIDLAALTRRVVATWLQTRQERANHTKCDLVTAWIEADRTRIEQILANLLDNAEKFSAGRGRIQIRVRVESGNAVLEVEDEGQGISPDNITRIFELFVQGPQPFDRPQGGIGLRRDARWRHQRSQSGSWPGSGIHRTSADIARAANGARDGERWQPARSPPHPDSRRRRRRPDHDGGNVDS
jgi:signal transduction histidine kinase